MKIDSALISKSIAYGGRYSSDTFNESHRALFGDNFVVSGFSLIDMTEVAEGVQLSITLGPGVFCSKGVFVKVLGETILTASTTPISPKVIVASTSDNKPETPVSIEFLSPVDVTEEMAVLGYYTPPFRFTEGVDTKAYVNRKQPFYRPASHVSMEELASDVASGLRAESHPANEAINNVVSLDGGASGHRLEVKNLSMASGDPSLLIFYMGTLLEEDTHYFIESPGTLVILGSTTLAYADDAPVTINNSYQKAFIDVLYSEDFLFRQKSFFVYTPLVDDYKIDIDPKFRDELQKGSFEPMIFVNRNNQSGGTLLNSDRFEVVSRRAEQGIRDSIKINPRVNWEGGANEGYVTDDYNGVPIASVTIIGVRGLSSNTTIARALDEPGRVPSEIVPKEFEALLPIVDGNNQHQGIPYKFMEVGTPYKVESGELQVFVDGKLAPCEHFMVNKLSNTGSSTPVLDEIGYQRYVSDKNSSAIEIGTKPIKNTREFGDAHPSVAFRSVNALNFRPSYLLPRTREFTYGSRSFNNLTEATQKPGITEALFNFTDDRYYDTAVSSFEFSDVLGAGFNGNYFVTMESLAGIANDSTSASHSVLSTLTMSVSMFFDVPLGVGLSLQEASKLTYFTGSGTGWYASGQDPTDADGGALTDSSSGLYTADIDPDKYFSDKNPIVTYAALDGYLQPWMDSFGFTSDATPPRAYLRNAGVTYDGDGNILTSFSDLMTNKDKVGGGGKSLIQVVDSIANSLTGTKVPIGTAHGYAYGGSIINLTNGSTHVSANPNQPSVATKFPQVESDGSGIVFEQGIYFGNTNFENPFKANTPDVYTSQVIKGYYTTDPSSCWYGIFSTPGASNSINPTIGERALTWNNITVILSPIPAGTPGFDHNDELMICRYRFLYLRPGTGLEIVSPSELDVYSAAGSTDTPDIGVEIFALTRGGSTGPSQALVEWSVWGPLDQEVSTHNHTSEMSNESENEHWFRIDSKTVDSNFGS